MQYIVDENTPQPMPVGKTERLSKIERARKSAFVLGISPHSSTIILVLSAFLNRGSFHITAPRGALDSTSPTTLLHRPVYSLFLVNKRSFDQLGRQRHLLTFN